MLKCVNCVVRDYFSLRGVYENRKFLLTLLCNHKNNLINESGITLFDFLLWLCADRRSVFYNRHMAYHGESRLCWWCSLIPVYNSYVMLKVSCMSGWWLLLYLAIGVVGQIPVNILSDYLWLVIPLGIAYLAVAFWQGYRLGRAFGKSTGFCIFSAILTPIAQIILAFDKSEWRDLDEPDWNQEIEA